MMNADHLQAQDAMATNEGSRGGERWTYEIRLLGNRFFHQDAVRWTGLSTVVTGLLFLTIFGFAGGAGTLPVAIGFTVMGLVLMLFCVVLYAVVMGNRVPVEFELTDEGVRMLARSHRNKGIQWTAIVLGLVRRNPAAVGAGIAGITQERVFVAWDELREVRRYPEDRVIFLRGDIFTRLRLYCTEDNYGRVSDKIEGHSKPFTEPSHGGRNP